MIHPLLLALAITTPALAGETKRYAFFITGDPQYLAEKSPAPTTLDPYSEQANSRFIKILNQFPGQPIPENLGGGHVAKSILGVIVTGDLVDSFDKTGGHYDAMGKYEWHRYVADYGLTGNDGKIPWPVYDLHGNHDGPQGNTFITDALIERNKIRPHVGHISSNGLHYSWDWGPLHGVSVGIFAGEGEERREGHHYAARASLEFLRKDLAEKVGGSGRPVIVSFHLHPNGPEYDWPAEDLHGFWETLTNYNVVALVHGHTHGSPPSKLTWDGKTFGRDLPDSIDVFNPDDSGAAKTDPRDPTKAVGLYHGLLYAELVDAPGTEDDTLVVRSYFTRDNWSTHTWHTRWQRNVSIP